MKKILFFLIFLSLCFEAFTQNKPERRIYLWDVTLSMKGHGGSPNIYNEVVDFLAREIESISDQSIEIVVLPFQMIILESWKVNATEEGKNDIIRKIRNYNNRRLTNTNIVGPIKNVQQNYINNDKRNMLFLLTDGKQTGGKQTGGKQTLLNLIRDWGQYAQINDAYAVYVMLTAGAVDRDIINIINRTERFDVITTPGVFDWIDLQPKELVEYNIKDDSGKPAYIDLFCKKNLALPENIKIKVSSINPYLVIDETVIIENSRIPVKLDYDYKKFRDTLPETTRIPIRIEIENQKEIQDRTGKIILINPNNIELELINKPPKTLKIYVKSIHDSKTKKNDSVLWGKVKYYNDLLFLKYKPVIMTQTLEFDFNEDAKRLIKDDILFEVVEKDNYDRIITANVNLYKNGVMCSDNILYVKPDEQSTELGIEFHNDAVEGSHALYLRVRSSGGLNQIDDNTDLSSIDDVILTHKWVVKKEHIINPLLKWIFWLFILIIVLLIIWCILIRPKRYETFKVKTLYITYPETMTPIRLNGFRKVICSKKKQSQPIFNKLLTGKIIFVQNDFWEQDIEVTPKDKKSVRVRAPRGFSIMPSNTVVIGADAEIKHNDKLAKIRIQ